MGAQAGAGNVCDVSGADIARGYELMADSRVACQFLQDLWETRLQEMLIF